MLKNWLVLIISFLKRLSIICFKHQIHSVRSLKSQSGQILIKCFNLTFFLLDLDWNSEKKCQIKTGSVTWGCSILKFAILMCILRFEMRYKSSPSDKPLSRSGSSPISGNIPNSWAYINLQRWVAKSKITQYLRNLILYVCVLCCA